MEPLGQLSREKRNEVLWLQYYNRYLYQQSVIDRTHYEKMSFLIRRRAHES